MTHSMLFLARPINYRSRWRALKSMVPMALYLRWQSYLMSVLPIAIIICSLLMNWTGNCSRSLNEILPTSLEDALVLGRHVEWNLLPHFCNRPGDMNRLLVYKLFEKRKENRRSIFPKDTTITNFHFPPSLLAIGHLVGGVRSYAKKSIHLYGFGWCMHPYIIIKLSDSPPPYYVV